MKKIVIALLLIVIIAVILIYSFIPSQLTISSSVAIPCPERAAERFLGSETGWNKWRNSNTPLAYNDCNFHIIKNMTDIIGIDMQSAGKTITSTINVTPIGTDSSLALWMCRIETLANPFQKLQQYFDAQQIQKNMTELLNEAKTFLQNRDSMYGIHIIETKVTDTVLINTKMSLTHYPETADIYNVITTLKNYAQQNNAAITGYPMMNVSKQKDTFKLQVALPVNKLLPANGAIVPKQMIPLKILVADVTGGAARVNEAFDQMQNYVDDYARESPAIPFISLITDRTQEADTSKWVSKIYYPVL